jgi:hypothetical protein
MVPVGVGGACGNGRTGIRNSSLTTHFASATVAKSAGPCRFQIPGDDSPRIRKPPYARAFFRSNCHHPKANS